MLTLFLLAAFSYLMGSFPTSVIVARRAKNIDIRDHGSGNAGGTNVLRVVGWKAALVVAIVDVGKGALAAALPAFCAPSSFSVSPADAGSICGACAVIGHVYPVFARFRGGKGVGTAAGMFATTQPLALALAAPIFFLAVWTTRWVSLGSVLGTLAIPFTIYFTRGGTWIGEHGVSFGVSIALAALIIFKHRQNIARMFHGNESRLEGAK
jgi:glycerol-3-phosphate acyltransferase PlsY